ncbi:stalk domain-containing protein [Paenibacillus sp. y28]|uniref:stalk domain-containing protein n=1 Tax=Paenibacillus sp. y28 TaxID=3129110 RepID=UPI00301AAC48
MRSSMKRGLAVLAGLGLAWSAAASPAFAKLPPQVSQTTGYLAVGTYLIHKNALSKDNVAAAQKTIGTSGQGMLYKSEFAGGAWIDLSKASGLAGLADPKGRSAVGASTVEAMKFSVWIDENGKLTNLLTAEELAKRQEELKKQQEQLNEKNEAAIEAGKHAEAAAIAVEANQVEAEAAFLQALGSGDSAGAAGLLARIGDPQAAVASLQEQAAELAGKLPPGTVSGIEPDAAAVNGQLDAARQDLAGLSELLAKAEAAGNEALAQELRIQQAAAQTAEAALQQQADELKVEELKAELDKLKQALKQAVDGGSSGAGTGSGSGAGSGAGGGAGAGAGTGSGSGAGSGAGGGAGAGAGTGSGSGAGSGAGGGAGAGAGTGSGSGAGSGAGGGAGAGAGTGSGSGAGSGAGAGAGAGTGSGSGAGSGAGEGAGAGTGSGSGTGSGAGEGAGAGTGSGSGTGSGAGAGAGAEIPGPAELAGLLLRAAEAEAQLAALLSGQIVKERGLLESKEQLQTELAAGPSDPAQLQQQLAAVLTELLRISQDQLFEQLAALRELPATAEARTEVQAKLLLELQQLQLQYYTPEEQAALAEAAALLAGSGVVEPLPVESVLSQTLPFKLEVPPVLIDGHVYIHIRPVSEAFGAVVLWDNSDQSVTVNRPGVIVHAKTNDPRAYINGEPIQLEAPPRLVEGRTMVPLRFVAEALGLTVTWISQPQTVRIEGFKQD